MIKPAPRDRDRAQYGIAYWAIASLMTLAFVGCVDRSSGPAIDKSQEGKLENRRADEDLKNLVESLKQDSANKDKSEPTRLAVDDDSVDELPGGLDNPTIEIQKHWAHLFPEKEVWIDTQAKEVIVGGRVCLTQGPLEMFICPESTKEHESIISANALSSEIHAALLAIGANPGKTASWNPEYRPAFGPQIEIELMWRDAKTNEVVKMSARDWIRNFKTKKRMEANFVFGGSIFDVNDNTGERYYLGDSGELVCLSNFSTATIDISVASSQDNMDLLYEAFSENIPPIGTQVYAVLKPGKIIGKVDSPEPTPSEKQSDVDDGTDEDQNTPSEADKNEGSKIEPPKEISDQK